MISAWALAWFRRSPGSASRSKRHGNAAEHTVPCMPSEYWEPLAVYQTVERAEVSNFHREFQMSEVAVTGRYSLGLVELVRSPIAVMPAPSKKSLYRVAMQPELWIEE